MLKNSSGNIFDCDLVIVQFILFIYNAQSKETTFNY